MCRTDTWAGGHMAPLVRAPPMPLSQADLNRQAWLLGLNCSHCPALPNPRGWQGLVLTDALSHLAHPQPAATPRRAPMFRTRAGALPLICLGSTVAQLANWRTRPPGRPGAPDHIAGESRIILAGLRWPLTGLGTGEEGESVRPEKGISTSNDLGGIRTAARTAAAMLSSAAMAMTSLSRLLMGGSVAGTVSALQGPGSLVVACCCSLSTSAVARSGSFASTSSQASRGESPYPLLQPGDGPLTVQVHSLSAGRG